MKATALLKQDHAAVKRLFTEFARTTARAQKTRQRLIDTIATELDIHAQIEEEIFYPALENVEGARPLLEEAHEEHQQVKELVAEVQGMDPVDPGLPKKLRELKDAVLHHAGEEEREMFPKAEELGADELERLGERLEERKQALSEGLVARTKRAVKKGIRKAA